MIIDTLFGANDAVRELIPTNGNAVAHHNRAVTTCTSRIEKYRSRGVRIFDKIDEHPEMFKPRAVFSIDADPIWAALQDIQQHILGDGSA